MTSPLPTSSDPKYLTLGPGTLIFGSEGAKNEWSDYVKSVTVERNPSTGDSVMVLSGRTLPGERRESAALKVTCFQTLKKGGIIDWSWQNDGKTVPFEFKPKDSKSAAVVKGTVEVRAVTIGGDVGSKPTSDVEFPIIGVPSFTPESE
ncbi:hypothetical protein HW450_10335 [Corynebacterium hindlerae]|uniref:Uncharacterized protein n=1 Tax=Corynebacterium hindlerae TaxID=699041 RepID=A0A7G5FDP0_9CORY|nr:hypothetical protein [Corynebacterium hindlerae]QMV84731.1 hypothetical protein HW450_10335 [Corynebacterium hindlerae]